MTTMSELRRPAADPGTTAPATSHVPAPARTTPLRQAMHTQAMVLAFYLIDTLLMAVLALRGALPAGAVAAFGVAGCGTTAVFAWLIRHGLHRRLGGTWFTTIQLMTACGLMLVTATAVPQIGVLLVLTLMVAVATAALQLPLKHVLAVSGLIAVVSLALLLVHGGRFGLPLDDFWERLASGTWFAVVLAKVAVINLIGTQMRRALRASNAQLAQALEQVQELSQRDDLTGLHNRRSMLALLEDERARFTRGGLAFGVALLDIDHFKHVNDRHGHAMGDEVLKTFAAVVSGTLRTTDRIARFGGEEFLLLLPNVTDPRSAPLAAERIRGVVGEHAWAGLAPGLAVTCSIGVTMCRAGEDVAAMLARADAALYRAKSEGRNRVCID